MFHVEIDRRPKLFCVGGDALQAPQDVRYAGGWIARLNARTKSGNLHRNINKRWLTRGKRAPNLPRASTFGQKIQELMILVLIFVRFPFAYDCLAQDIHREASALTPDPAKV